MGLRGYIPLYKFDVYLIPNLSIDSIVDFPPLNYQICLDSHGLFFYKLDFDQKNLYCILL